MSSHDWYYYQGIWKKRSERFEGYFNYRIEVQEDGVFEINESDEELIRKEKQRSFASLLEAQRFCDAIEAQALEPSPFSRGEA